MLIKLAARSFSSFSSTFTRRVAGKTNLKEFFKHTHPDLLTNAPRKITDTNTDSIQELNSYLQNLEGMK
jgi:hypothetical protein